MQHLSTPLDREFSRVNSASSSGIIRRPDLLWMHNNLPPTLKLQTSTQDVSWSCCQPSHRATCLTGANRKSTGADGKSRGPAISSVPLRCVGPQAAPRPPGNMSQFPFLLKCRDFYPYKHLRRMFPHEPFSVSTNSYPYHYLKKQ